ncbi:MAG: hypothetical protein WC444_00355 [Candidatus Paceibacterota bacterium]
MKKLIFKCSNVYCSFEEILKSDTTAVKVGDVCFICNEGKIFSGELYKKIDPLKYPTLSKYPPEVVWATVSNLIERYPDMTDNQCLTNLEMDFAQKEQMA